MNIYNTKDIEKFHTSYTIDPVTDCWNWNIIYKNRTYGEFWLPRPTGLKKAHRVSYELHIGDPAGKLVCHKCDNPRCVNPKHLFLGTQQDNIQDKVQKGRQCKKPKPTHKCPHCGRLIAAHMFNRYHNNMCKKKP